ncbi:hypothetical protein V8B97DRAFT_2033393 [Scleroderma yunnanense]
MAPYLLYIYLVIYVRPIADNCSDANPLPLNPALHAPSPDEVAFLKATTGIDDDDELNSIQVAPYPCFYGFGFIKTAISAQPVYQDHLNSGRDRKDAILLEVGCGLSAEARRVALNGFPAHNIVSTDIVQVVPPTRGPAQNSLPDLLSLTSLSPLHGHCSVITASVFFQLFTEEQVHLARALAGLLSPEPGSLICSVNMGAKVKGLVHYNTTGKDFNLFPHLEELWDGTVFEKGEIDVWAKYGEVEFMGEKILICFANSLSRRNKVSSDTRHQE